MLLSGSHIKFWKIALDNCRTDSLLWKHQTWLVLGKVAVLDYSSHFPLANPGWGILEMVVVGFSGSLAMF